MRAPFAPALGALALAATAAAQPCTTWESVGPLPAGGRLRAVAFAQGKFVAVGMDGLIATSVDGESWKMQRSQSARRLSGVAFGGGGWVVVGDGGTVLTSVDGESWVPRATGSVATLSSVAWGADRFVAVGSGGTIVSLDGVSWREGHRTVLFSGIASDGAMFVAVGWDGIATSADGITWTNRAVVPRGGLQGVGWRRGLFVAVGWFGQILTAPEGITWTARQSGTNQALQAVAGNENVVAAVGDGAIVTSSDGRMWISQSIGGLGSFTGIAWGAGRFVAVGPSSQLVTSPDGASWQGQGYSLWSVAAGATGMVAVGNVVLWSPDGLAWRRVALPPDRLMLAVVASGRGFVAVGRSAAVLTSEDGQTWVVRDSGLGPTSWLSDVSADGGTLVAVGTNGAVITSRDGTTWIPHDVGAKTDLASVAWSGSRFVAVGRQSLVTSVDGDQWQARDPAVLSQIMAAKVRCNGAGCVAVGQGAATSIDGEKWTPGVVDQSVELRDLAWTGTTWVAVGSQKNSMRAVVAVSRDGYAWDVRLLPEWQTGLYGIAVGADGIVAVGWTNAILRSACSSGGIVVPTAAHSPGANKTQWRTDLEVFNPRATSIAYTIELLKRDQDNSAPHGMSFTLDPLLSVRYLDLLGVTTRFDGAAALRIRPTSPVAPLLVTSRTYNDTDRGTFGQFVPAVSPEQALEAGKVASLQQLSHSASAATGYRTNIGLINLTATPITVVIRLFTSTATELGTVGVDLRPFEFRQLDRVFAGVTSGDVDAGYALVHTDTAGARFAAYASVIDNRSGDPIFISAR